VCRQLGVLDLAVIIGRQVDLGGGDVLLESVQLRGARDRHDPWFLGEEPGERDLRGRRALPLCDVRQHVDEGEVGLPRLPVDEARDGVAEVAARELGVLVDLAGEEALAEWAEGDEADAELLERRQDRLLRLAPPEREFALERSDGLHRMCTADGLHACLGEAEVSDLALLDQLLDGARHVLDLDVRVDAVLVEQVDRVRAEPVQ